MPERIRQEMKGRTILQVIPSLEGGGAETTTLEITEALGVAGARALIASQGGGLEGRLKTLGGEMIHLPVASKNPFNMWRNIGRLAALIRRERVDIIHARSRAPAWSCLFAARACHIPYLATYHSKVHAGPKLKVFYNSVMTRGALTIANSQFTAERIQQIHRLTQAQLRVIPRGCDIDALAREQWSPSQIGAQRAAWGFGGNDFVIICPARLTEWKGQHVLSAALGRLKSDVKPVLVLAGSAQGRGAYVARLENLIAEYDLQKRVHFAGHIDNMPLAYAAANMAVVPSIEAEPFGRTLIEASGAGLPVVASDDGGFRETVITGDVKDGASGWLVPPGDVVQLANCLDEALAMAPEALFQMGRNGRAYVAAHFTRAAMCAATLAVYQELSG